MAGCVALAQVCGLVLSTSSSFSASLQVVLLRLDCVVALQYMTASEVLPKRAVRQTVKLLNSHTFVAKSALLSAIGGCTGEDLKPAGLLTLDRALWAPSVHDIVGHDNVSGLLGAMQSSDWQTRKAAVDCFRTLVICSGPDLTSTLLSREVWSCHSRAALCSMCSL